MSRIQRTNVGLSPETYNEALRIAQERNTSIVEIVNKGVQFVSLLDDESLDQLIAIVEICYLLKTAQATITKDSEFMQAFGRKMLKNVNL